MCKFLYNEGYDVGVSEWYPVVEYGGDHKGRKISIYPCKLEDNKATGNLIAITNKNDFAKIINDITKYLNR